MALFSGLLRRFGEAFDPDRVAVLQALLARDPASQEMAQRFRQLQADRERLRTWRRFDRNLPDGDQLRAAPGDYRPPLGSGREQQSQALADPVALEMESGGLADALSGAGALIGDQMPGISTTGQQPHARGAQGQVPISEPHGSVHVGDPRGPFEGEQAGAPWQVEGPRRPYRTPEAIVRDKLRLAGGLNGHGYVPTTSDDVNLLARAIYSEFGEYRPPYDTWKDMIPGGWSIVNRIRPSTWQQNGRPELGASLTDVLQRRDRHGVPQFSFMPPGGIGASGGSPQWQESAHPEQMRGISRKAWDLSVSAAKQILGGAVSDPTRGGTGYHSWRQGAPPRVIGWYGTASRGPHPTIKLGPYQNPTGADYFYQVLRDPLRQPFGEPDPDGSAKPRRR